MHETSGLFLALYLVLEVSIFGSVHFLSRKVTKLVFFGKKTATDSN